MCMDLCMASKPNHPAVWQPSQRCKRRPLLPPPLLSLCRHQSLHKLVLCPKIAPAKEEHLPLSA